MKEALYYRKEGTACRCLLCPRECRIADGQAGFCRVRAAKDGRLYALNYGAASALALDPVEKKPLYRFHPGTYILSYGSYGCNMRCAWCQNSSISQSAAPADAARLTPEELADRAREAAAAPRAADSRRDTARPALRTAAGNIGVAFTYNEPLISPEFILDTAPLLRAAGLAAVLVTNAMIHEKPFADILPHIDAMNIDLKSFSEDVYARNGGYLDTVRRNIRAAADAGRHVEVTTLIIPGENDSEEEMYAEAEWLAGIDPDIPLHITRFFPRYHMTDREPTPVKTIERLAEAASRSLRYVYPGNI
jgi:pyruvate formate lyase activating enzyme